MYINTDMFDSFFFEPRAPMLVIGLYFCYEAWAQTPNKEAFGIWFRQHFVRK